VSCGKNFTAVEGFRIEVGCDHDKVVGPELVTGGQQTKPGLAVEFGLIREPKKDRVGFGVELVITRNTSVTAENFLD
jgi:hypothetical protein